MKKILSLTLATAMMFILLVGCSSKPADPAPAQNTAEVESAAKEFTPPADAEVANMDTDWIWEDPATSGEVNFWIPFKGNQGMDAMIAEFNSYYPNITVNLNTYNNNADGNVAVNTAIMAGEVDVLASFNALNTYNRWSNNLYIDITDKVAAEGIDLIEQWGTDVYKYEDRIYSLPCGGVVYYVSVNMDLWNKAGLGELPTSWTWDEYLEACKAMTEVAADGSVNVYGGTDYHAHDLVTYPYAQVYGGDMYYTPEGKASFDDPVIIQALEREVQAELVDKVWYPKYQYSSDNTQTQMIFCTGLAATAISSNMVRFLADTNTYPDVKWKTGFVPYPICEEGQYNYLEGVYPFSHAGICTNCQDESAAWVFLKWYSTYGVKYLTAAGHQSNWKGTDTSELASIIWGSKEEAEKWVDLESFERVVGRTDLETWVQDDLTAYSDVAKAFSSRILSALAGEITPEECLKAAAEDANNSIAAAK